MLLYNEELGTEDCKINPDSTTKQFLVAFFGFYKHHIADDFENFIRELGMKNVIDKSANFDTFSLDGNLGLEAYNCCDRRTFDVTIIVPKTFTSEVEALNWFNTKVKDSNFIKKSEICEIGVVDAEKLLIFLGVKIDYRKKVKAIDDAFTENIKLLKESMLAEFKNDDDFKEIINSKFNCINV